MEKYSSIPEILLVGALLSAGAILFLVSRKVIEQLGIFRGKQAVVTAISISWLIVASIAILLLVPSRTVENEHDQLRMNFSLLPGVAVAGTIILLQLFVIVAATQPKYPEKIPARESVQKPAKLKLPERPKKAESKNPSVPQKPAGKG